MLPSASRAMSCSESSPTAICSASTMCRSCAAIALVLIVRNSYTCERESTVSGIFSSSVVAIMKTTCGGGSSIDLSKALKDGAESWCTSSMMKIL